MPTLLIHIQNEEAVVGEVDELPSPNDTMIVVKNPRRKDGKEIPNLDPNVMTVIWPVWRLNYIELLSSEEEEIIGFVRK